MKDLLLHTCCGPCATVAVPAWRDRGIEPVAWFHNPNIQPAAELERRDVALRRFADATYLELVVAPETPAPEWREWSERTGSEAGFSGPEERCQRCLELRLRAAASAAAERGHSRFSTTLTVSPYQRHDLIRAAGDAAADVSGVEFVYLDLRGGYRDSYAESRRLSLYRQPYCGCAASKWEAWHARQERRRST